MMSKLFEVEITVRAVVVAENETSAFIVARDNANDIWRDDSHDDIFVAQEITDERKLPPGWDVKCLPYGDHEDSTIAEFILAQPAPPERDTKTIDMFQEQSC